LVGEVSGLVVTSTSSEVSTTARIRGIGTVGDNIGLESSVGVVIDGVYRPRNGVGFGDLGELERIEVLKGPQGTVFGKNTSAGVINVISKRPDFVGGADAELTATNFGGYETTASINGPLVDDKLAGRFYAAYRRRDGLYDVSTGDGTRETREDANRDVVVGRGQLLFTPSEGVSALFIADYARRTENCCGAVQNNDGATAPLMDAVSPTPGVASRGPVRASPVRKSFGRAGDSGHGFVRGAQFRNVVWQDHLDHRVAQFRIDDRTGRRLQHGRRAVAKYRRSQRQRVQPTVRGAAFLR
jgi:outer membrane receptor protein involved in Fe transport